MKPILLIISEFKLIKCGICVLLTTNTGKLQKNFNNSWVAVYLLNAAIDPQRSRKSTLLPYWNEGIVFGSDILPSVLWWMHVMTLRTQTKKICLSVCLSPRDLWDFTQIWHNVFFGKVTVHTVFWTSLMHFLNRLPYKLSRYFDILEWYI